MARIKLREFAEQAGLSLSDVQRRSGLSFPLLRRYWYNTKDGSVTGPKLRMVSLDALDTLAAILHVQPGDLIVPDGPPDETPPPA